MNRLIKWRIASWILLISRDSGSFPINQPLCLFFFVSAVNSTNLCSTVPLNSRRTLDTVTLPRLLMRSAQCKWEHVGSVPEDSDGRTALLPEKRRMIHTAEIIHSQFSSFDSPSSENDKRILRNQNLLNRIREAAVFVLVDFQPLHMQRFAVLSESLKE